MDIFIKNIDNFRKYTQNIYKKNYQEYNIEMTKQKTIKHNKEVYGPMYQMLRDIGQGLIHSDSEIAAFALWYLLRFLKKPYLDEESRYKVLKKIENIKEPDEIVFLKTIKEFRKFIDLLKKEKDINKVICDQWFH